MIQSTSDAYRSPRSTSFAAEGKLDQTAFFFRSFVVAASLLLPTLALATIAQAQTSFDSLDTTEIVAEPQIAVVD